MKLWKLNLGTVLSAAVCASLAASCTVKVGDGSSNFDDTDDLDFSDKEPSPEAGGSVDTSDESDTDSTEDSTEQTHTTDTSETSETDTSTEPTNTTDSSEPTDTTTTDPTSTDTTDDTTTGPDPMMCPGEAETGSCEECIQLSCSYEWDNCCGTGCGSEWTYIQDCMIETASEDALADLDRCSEEASPTGDALDLMDATLALRSCVVSDFMGDPEMDPLLREEGDGTCTFACFYVNEL